MPKLWTYTTIDCPAENLFWAEEFLKREFNMIDWTVRRVMNPHDFWSYPSFEIDMPTEFEDIDDDTGDKKLKKYEKWIEKANEIEQEYYRKFHNF